MLTLIRCCLALVAGAPIPLFTGATVPQAHIIIPEGFEPTHVAWHEKRHRLCVLMSANAPSHDQRYAEYGSDGASGLDYAVPREWTFVSPLFRLGDRVAAIERTGPFFIRGRVVEFGERGATRTPVEVSDPAALDRSLDDAASRKARETLGRERYAGPPLPGARAPETERESANLHIHLPGPGERFAWSASGAYVFAGWNRVDKHLLMFARSGDRPQQSSLSPIIEKALGPGTYSLGAARIDGHRLALALDPDRGKVPDREVAWFELSADGATFAASKRGLLAYTMCNVKAIRQ
jgi:hypothetical protein